MKMLKKHLQLLIVILLAFCAVFSAACAARQSVAHLTTVNWPGTAGSEQLLTAKYLEFDFSGEQKDGDYIISGQIRAVDGMLPKWADWREDLWLAAYLTDAKGNILASKATIIPAGAWNEQQAIPFKLELASLDLIAKAPTKITFGYRLLLKEKNLSSSKDDERTFFATEAAVNKF